MSTQVVNMPDWGSTLSPETCFYEAEGLTLGCEHFPFLLHYYQLIYQIFKYSIYIKRMFSNTLWAKESLLKRNSRTGIWTDKKYQHSYYPGGSQQLQRSIHASLLSLLGWGDSLVDIMFAVPQRDWVSAVQNAGIVMSFRIIYWFWHRSKAFIQYFVHLSALVIVKLNDRIVVGYRIITAAVCTPNHKELGCWEADFRIKKP